MRANSGRAVAVRLAAALTVSVAVSLTGCAASAPASEARSEARSTASADLEVLGFQESSTPVARIDASARALTWVGVDGVTLASGGDSVHDVSPEARAQLHRAHAEHLPAELLVSNFDDGIGDFSPDLGRALLSSPAHRAAVVSQLAGDVHHDGWDGVMVDLESLRRADGDGLTAFLRQLHAALGSDIRLDVAVMAATSDGEYRDLGYRLADIADTVDRVTLMTYDEHGPWDPAHPGPIGALDWQKTALAAALHEVPASQLDLGVAGYGYAWGPSARDAYSDQDARDVAGDAARWDAAAGEWTATLADGTVLWWSDARSLRLRIELARAQGLRGVAVWSLGQSDPLSS